MSLPARVLVYCLAGGLPMTVAAMGAGHFGWWWLAGIAMSAAFVPIALRGPRGVLRQLAVIAPVLVLVTCVLTWTEALVFVPAAFHGQAVASLAGSLFLFVLTAIVLAALAGLLRLTQAEGPIPSRRPAWTAALLVVASGLAYAVYYLIFGAITYQFFTRQYYPDAEALVARLGPWFWPMQVGRGALMALAVLPAIYALRMSRGRAALAIGVLLWVAGGLAPLIPPNELMGGAQRLIHVFEILTQNGLLGLTAVLLLRPRAPSAPVAQQARGPAAA